MTNWLKGQKEKDGWKTRKKEILKVDREKTCAEDKVERKELR